MLPVVDKCVKVPSQVKQSSLVPSATLFLSKGTLNSAQMINPCRVHSHRESVMDTPLGFLVSGKKAKRSVFSCTVFKINPINFELFKNCAQFAIRSFSNLLTSKKVDSINGASTVKKPDICLKEYCQKLSEENLKFLAGRLTQRLGGDLAEVLTFLSGVREVDRLLASAETCYDVYDTLDALQVVVIKECEKRSLSAVA